MVNKPPAQAGGPVNLTLIKGSVSAQVLLIVFFLLFSSVIKNL